jgi:L-alanine-DL-glutamate epimerase-like enolase superfamily enzyme
MSTGLTIDRVESWACRVGLPRPLSFGTFTVTARDYVCIRVITSGGLVADVIGHTRGSPVDVAVSDLLAPRLLGRDAFNLGTCLTEMRRATIATEDDGVIGRARSLLDIALWDLRAQALGIPVWQLAGGAPREVPVLLVEGYRQEGEAEADVAGRLSARITEGYRLLKLEAAHYGAAEPLVRIIDDAGPDARYVLDLAWSWRTAREGVAAARAWAGLPIDWLEDPMPRGRRQELAFLRSHSPVPVGIGDECTRADDLQDLADVGALDVVRIDATTIGGYSVALPLATAMQARGLRVSFHVNPEVHRHAVFASEVADHLEMFPADRPFDASHVLLQSPAFGDVAGGRLAPPSAPGTGLRLDDRAVARHALRHMVRSAP